jgi:hypothetical protein
MTREEAEKEIRDNFNKVWADGIIKALEQEPRKGHWIDNTDLGYHVSICSNCDWRGHGDTCLIYKPNYCPHCGASMEGR